LITLPPRRVLESSLKEGWNKGRVQLVECRYCFGAFQPSPCHHSTDHGAVLLLDRRLVVFLVSAASGGFDLVVPAIIYQHVIDKHAIVVHIETKHCEREFPPNCANRFGNIVCSRTSIPMASVQPEAMSGQHQAVDMLHTIGFCNAPLCPSRRSLARDHSSRQRSVQRYFFATGC